MSKVICTCLSKAFLVAIMHLSLSTPTYPRLGNGWGFVAICQHNLSPGFGICPRIFIVIGIPIQNVGNLQHKIVPRGGEFVKRLLQIPNNPHPCLTWGRWGVTMIGALQDKGEHEHSFYGTPQYVWSHW